MVCEDKFGCEVQGCIYYFSGQCLGTVDLGSLVLYDE